MIVISSTSPADGLTAEEVHQTGSLVGGVPSPAAGGGRGSVAPRAPASMDAQRENARKAAARANAPKRKSKVSVWGMLLLGSVVAAIGGVVVLAFISADDNVEV